MKEIILLIINFYKNLKDNNLVAFKYCDKKGNDNDIILTQMAPPIILLVY